MLNFKKTSDKTENTPIESTVNFENSLHEVEDLSLIAKKHSPVAKVDEHGKFLKLGFRKVTGKELNTMAIHLDDSINQTKKVQFQTLQHIIQLYQALDALDSEHIAGILTAIEAAETATNWARVNDENIGKITNYLMQDERVLALKKEQEQQENRITTLENRLKTVYWITGSAVVIAFASLILCLILLI